jgi:ABC-type antimicrobial peptide transport system ATPase subunit
MRNLSPVVCKVFKNVSNSFNLGFFDRNNHNTVDSRVTAKFKQKREISFEAKSGSGKRSLAFIVDEINVVIFNMRTFSRRE